MKEKINKLATQHKVIGVKTDCPHFSNIGNILEYEFRKEKI